MGAYNINITELLKLAYRVTPIRYTVRPQTATNGNNNYSVTATNAANNSNAFQSVQLIKDDSPLRSVFGQPIINPIAIQPFEYNLHTGSFELQNFEGYRFPDATMFSIHQRKIIQKTKVQGRSGTVKEYISAGDYEIKIQGLILDTDDTVYPATNSRQKPKSSIYPKSQVRAMHRLCDIPAALPVQNDFLNAMGVYHIVIMAFEFPETYNFENAQAFSITALSDHTFNIRNTNEPLNPNL